MTPPRFVIIPSSTLTDFYQRPYQDLATIVGFGHLDVDTA